MVILFSFYYSGDSVGPDFARLDDITPANIIIYAQPQPRLRLLRDDIPAAASYFMEKFMTNHQSKDPLHGITLEMILNHLVEQYGWDELGKRIPIKCFTNDPSVKSSLKFLRRTPWARKKVEELYLKSAPE